MKKKENLKELRVKNNKELFRDLTSLQKKMTELKFKTSFRKLKNYHEITVVRKKIAQIWTVLSENTTKDLEKELDKQTKEKDIITKDKENVKAN